MTIKLRPYNPTVPTPRKWDGLVQCAECGDGVEAFAVFPDGTPVTSGKLVVVGASGLFRYRDVSPSLGLPLDRLGRLRFDCETDQLSTISALEAEVARLKGSDAPPDKGAWRAMEEDQKRDGWCLCWDNEEPAWFCADWRDVPVGYWVREQPPPPPGGGA